MRPIRDIAELGEHDVLYHSAFGFAQVAHIGEAELVVRWERDAPHLPDRVSREHLLRVYSLCEPGGFFARAVTAPDGIREELLTNPVGAMEALLQDLVGPQRRDDIREWLVSRGLLTNRGFEQWWTDVHPHLADDARFRIDNGWVGLQRPQKATGPAEQQLDNPLIAPARRLDVALAHRATLGERRFRQEVLLAWRTGTPQVRELSLAALKDVPPDDVISGLLAPGPDNIDAVVHALRRSGWQPVSLSEMTHAALRDRVRRGFEDGSTDGEGRLAAALVVWGAPGIVDFVAELASHARGQAILEATFGALAPRRVRDLLVELLTRAIAADPGSDASRFAGRTLLRNEGTDMPTLANALEAEHPTVAKWLRERMEGWDPEGDTTEEGPLTMEIEMEPLDVEPAPLERLPPRSGRALMDLGLALADALARRHVQGVPVHPSRSTIRLLPDGNVQLPDGPADGSTRPPGEEPSLSGDIYGAAVALLEVIIGRAWPRAIPADRALPYLRLVAPDLPPSALAPLEMALHAVPAMRPQDGAAWLETWRRCNNAERARSRSALDLSARLDLGYDSHVGRMKLLQTQTNQDALFAAAKGNISLMVVCDGISTANAGSGDVASGITAHVVASLWEQSLSRLQDSDDEARRDFLERALRTANRAVCEASLRFAGGDLEGRVPMGTTALTAVARGNDITIAWLGDSRAYLVGPYGASLLTADQNQAGDRLRLWHGGLEPAWDPTGFALVGYIGHFNEAGRPEALAPSFGAVSLLPDERLVLATDGITDYIGDTHPEVNATLAAEAGIGPVDQAARRLVELANRGGGGDNASVVIAAFRESS